MKHLTLLMILFCLSTACGEIAQSSDDAQRHEAFLVDGKSDSTGVEEGSIQATAVLGFVNTATVSQLRAAGLDDRTIDQLIETRSNAGNLKTLAGLDAVPYFGKQAFASIVIHVESMGGFTSSVFGILEASGDADAILELVAVAPEHMLNAEVALSIAASKSIVKSRRVSPISTLEDLAAIEHVDASTFRQLQRFISIPVTDVANHDAFIKALAKTIDGIDATETDYFEYVERARSTDVPTVIHKMTERYIAETIEDWDLYNEPGLLSADIIGYYVITDGHETVGYIVSVGDQIAVENVPTTGVHIFATLTGRVVSKRGWSK